VLIYLGCRISEALALQTKDIDFNRGTVTIQHLK
jgi:integrase